MLGQKELSALSDDPDELEQQLQAMAGPAAGPSGGTNLNGAAIKAEGQAMVDKLMEQITMYQFGEVPLSLIIG